MKESRWSEPFRAAFQSLWVHRLRSILTTLGIIIGVSSVVAVVQLMKSLEGRIMADVNRSGSHTFFLSPWVPTSVWKSGKKVRWQALEQDQIRELKEMVPQVQVASPSYTIWSRNLMAKIGPHAQRVSLQGVDENGLELAGLDLACGRSFTVTDRVTRAPVVVVGAKLAKDLDLSEVDLGRTLTLGGQTAELVGILKKQGEIPFMPTDEEAADWGPDGQAYIPFGSFKELNHPRTLELMSWRLQVDPTIGDVKDAEEQLRLALRRVRGLRGDDPDNFEVTTNRKTVEMMEKLSKTLLLASGAMVGVSLLVGGIGVMNIMLVSVTERTREIGVRKAIGARRKHILVQFLIEAMVLCAVGGVLGLLVGGLLGTILSQVLMKHLAAIPVWALVSAVLVPSGVGLLFGLYPANRAAKMDPIEALRYE